MPRKNNKNQYRYNDELDELFETSSGINDSEKKDAINDLLKKYPKMSRSIAGQIASGNYLISRYIGKINNKRKLDKINKIDDLLKKYPDMKRSEAGQIISGNLNLEEYKKSREIKLKKEVKKNNFLKKLEDLILKYPEMKEKTARKIAMGHITIDDYLASLEKKKRKQNAL